MDVQSPEPPGRFSLCLDVYSPPQVLQIDGRLCHLVLAFLVVGDVTNTRPPPLHGHYSASFLLRTLPPPRSERAASIRFRLPMLPSPSSCGLGLRGYSLSRPHSRSLLLRPGD